MAQVRVDPKHSCLLNIEQPLCQTLVEVFYLILSIILTNADVLEDVWFEFVLGEMHKTYDKKCQKLSLAL